jgi:hypothetical protein
MKTVAKLLLQGLLKAATEHPELLLAVVQAITDAHGKGK